MKKLLCMILVLLLCASSALADVVIPPLPGRSGRYIATRIGDATEHKNFRMKNVCSEEELADFVRELEKMGFRRGGTEECQEFTWTGKEAFDLSTFRGSASHKKIHLQVQRIGAGLAIRVADGLRPESAADRLRDSLEAADAKSSATQSASQEKNTLPERLLTVVVEAGDYYRAHDLATTEEYVLNVLLSEDLVAGDEKEWGLHITTVDGIVADWEGAGESWVIQKFNYDTGERETVSNRLNGVMFEDRDIYYFTLAQ